MHAQLVIDSTNSRSSLPELPPSPVADDIAAAASGDRRAYERLYRAHVDRVFSLCVRMLGDRQTAEEATQDVFVRVWEKLPGFRGESAFSTWLHRVAVNVVLSRRKTASVSCLNVSRSSSGWRS